MHAGGRRFDPVWLHHIPDAQLLIDAFDAKTGVFASLLFNNLEQVFDVLSGSVAQDYLCYGYISSVAFAHVA